MRAYEKQSSGLYNNLSLLVGCSCRFRTCGLSHSPAAPLRKLWNNTSRSTYHCRKAEAGKRPVQQLQNENQSKPIVTTATVCSDFGARLFGAASETRRPHIRSDERRGASYSNLEWTLSFCCKMYCLLAHYWCCIGVTTRHFLSSVVTQQPHDNEATNARLA